MAAAGRDPAVTVGMVGELSSSIELVLSKNYLPVAQIRVICKNGPQVSIDDIKLATAFIIQQMKMKNRIGTLNR
jgi:hypothetical protein